MNRRSLLTTGLALGLSADLFAQKLPALAIAPFEVELTPPKNTPSCRVPELITKFEHPLLAKGILLRDNNTKESFVIVAIDWLGICNSSYRKMQVEVAKAIDTKPDNVAIQCVHQHTAPMFDSDAQTLLDNVKANVRMSNDEYLDKAAGILAKTVAGVSEKLVPLTQVGTTWAVAERLASSRRIALPDGKLFARMSNTKGNPEGRKMPEGKIDPFVRTVSFWNHDKPVAYFHYYASHPMSYYGDGRASYDVPGLARTQLEKETKVPHIYFTGCGADVGFGKYNDGLPERRAELADRLYDALKRSVDSKPLLTPVSELTWGTIELPFTSRQDAEFSEETHRKRIADGKLTGTLRAKSAMLLAYHERLKKGKQPLQASVLALGGVRIFNLPSEIFVEYQLWLQSQFPSEFIAVAAYGDCSVWYVPDDHAYTTKGGYEQTWAFSQPCEEKLKRVLKKLGESVAKKV